MLINGLINAHMIPAKACLYLTKKSLFARLFNRLLYLRISLIEKKELKSESIIILSCFDKAEHKDKKAFALLKTNFLKILTSFV